MWTASRTSLPAFQWFFKIKNLFKFSWAITIFDPTNLRSRRQPPYSSTNPPGHRECATATPARGHTQGNETLPSCFGHDTSLAFFEAHQASSPQSQWRRMVNGRHRKSIHRHWFWLAWFRSQCAWIFSYFRVCWFVESVCPLDVSSLKVRREERRRMAVGVAVTKSPNSSGWIFLLHPWLLSNQWHKACLWCASRAVPTAAQPLAARPWRCWNGGCLWMIVGWVGSKLW